MSWSIADIDRFGQCEGWGLTDPPKMARTSVARWVSMMAQHRLAMLTQPDPPSALAFDSVTPLPSDGTVQREKIVNAARGRLDDLGWTVMQPDDEHHWYKWRVPIRLWHSADSVAGTALLLTDLRIGSAWLELGFLMHSAWLAENVQPPVSAVLIHARRTSLGRDQQASIEVRPADEVIAATVRRKQRISAVIDGAPPLLTPGEHCDRCPQATVCPVSAA